MGGTLPLIDFGYGGGYIRPRILTGIKTKIMFEGLSEQQRKKAWRRAAMEHHPDRGGDEELFKKILNEYESTKPHTDQKPWAAKYEWDVPPKKEEEPYEFEIDQDGCLTLLIVIIIFGSLILKLVL